MAENFEKISDNLTDPSRVRNFLKDAYNDSQRRQYGILFHIAYALLCSLVLYFAADAAAFPSLQGLGTVFLFVAPAMCVFTFLYSPPALKALPVALPLLLIVIRQALCSFAGGFLGIASILFVYILCIMSAALIAKSVISGYTKVALFVILSVVFGLICFCQIMFAFIAANGTFSFSLLLDSIGKAGESIINQSMAFAQTPEGLEALKSMAVSGKNLTDEQLLSVFRESVEMSVKTVTPLLPSFFALSCMLYGFIEVAVFSFFAKHFRINVFVCIMDKEWTYRPSLVSSAVYDIIFFVFILSMFTNLPQNISVTVINLMIVLTPLMFISGIRGIHSMLFKKTKNKSLSAVITTVIIMIALAITGGFAFLIVGSVGVTYITARNREERIIVPVKYASDLAYLRKMTQDTDNTLPETPEENNNDTPENQ